MSKLPGAPCSLTSISALLAILAIAPSLHADWIQLESGVQIHGTILRQTEDEVTLELARGGVSSFDARIVVEVNRVEPERRARLEVGPKTDDEDALPSGLHPRPDATRSSRRAVPGGTLLLPEDAVEGTLIEPASAPQEGPSPSTDGAKPSDAPLAGAARRWLAVLTLDRGRSIVRVGRMRSVAEDEQQTDRIRASLADHRTGTVHSLDRHKIAGRTTWVAERTVGEGRDRARIITGWVRANRDTLQVVEIELPETLFLENPYRYRVIPRSFRPEPAGTGPGAANMPPRKNP